MRNILLLCLCAPVVLFAADPPYAGKWKMNVQQSDFSETTVAYENLPNGEWRSTMNGQSYTFKLDGKAYPDGFGGTVAWTASSANSWSTIWKIKTQTATDDVKLGADGTLTFHTTGTKPNGDPIDETAVYQRISGTSGLAGKWKTKAYSSSSVGVLEFVASGTDGLTLKQPAQGLTCAAQLDGKDYPCTGASIPVGFTVVMAKAGPRALDMTVKKDGKALSKMTYTVAPDGKSMTGVGGALATNEKIRRVYDRQ